MREHVGNLPCGCSDENLCGEAVKLWLIAAIRYAQYLLTTGAEVARARDRYKTALAAYEAHFVGDVEDIDERRERLEDFIPF